MRNAPVRYSRASNAWLRWSLAAWVTSAVPVVLAGDAAVVLRLDADWVTWIRAQRRAQGLDAPDASADAQFQAMLQRLQPREEAEPSPAVQRALATQGAAGARCSEPAAPSAREPGAAEAACAERREVD